MARFLYREPVGRFLDDAAHERLVDRLTERLIAVAGAPPAHNEQQAWANSLSALATVLAEPALASGEIFVELFMPLNGQRCDALLTGRDHDGDHAVLIELKQWSSVIPSHLPEHVLVPGGYQSLHPSAQVRDYVQTLRHFHSAFTDGGSPIRLSGVAYLHNMSRKAAQHLRDHVVFGSLPTDFPLYLKDEWRAFAQWLTARLVPGPGRPLADRIAAGKPLASPKLLDLLVQTIQGEHEWQLLDVQRTVDFQIKQAVQIARDTGEKAVVVVRGGPGTGKSVLAIQLLAYAAKQHWKVAHATGSKAFQTVLQAKTQHFALSKLKALHGAKFKKDLPVKELFATFADVAKVGAKDPDTFDLTVCDEAHRLWRHRRKVLYPSRRVQWLSETSMVEELIHASKVTAFFLDDNQSVRSGEIGRSDDIIEAANRLGIKVHRLELDQQFRCAGSESYIRWVEGVLGWQEHLDLEWKADHTYQVRVWDDMQPMVNFLRAEHEGGRRARLVAGFCWRWSNPKFEGQLQHDLSDPRFGEWSGAWIEKTEQNLKPLLHRYYRWATRPDAFDQVGSIYSVQGFEFDHVGVIWGEDLVWRRDRWVADLSKNKDGTFKKELKTSGASAEEKLLNVYRVLLTRGMTSTHLFILDDETRAHVAACLAGQADLRRQVANAPAPPPPVQLSLIKPDHPSQARVVDRPAKDTALPSLPIVDLQAAAGGFGADLLDLADPAHAERWLVWADAPKDPGCFVARVKGDSMAPLIADGAWCIFRPTTLEALSHRPALVRTEGLDPSGGRFTVKHVRVTWGHDAEGRLVRTKLTLASENPAYPDLEIPATAGDDGRHVVAELVRVFGQTLPG